MKDKSKQKREPLSDLDISFNEAVARFIQTDPKEVMDVHQRIQERQREIEKNAAEHKADIKRGARAPGKRFRL